MAPQATGFPGGMRPQATGYPGSMMGGGMMPQATGMPMMPQATGMGGPAFAPGLQNQFVSTFMPTQQFQQQAQQQHLAGSMLQPSQMSFAQAPASFAGTGAGQQQQQSLQQQFQQHAQSNIPWKLSKDEKRQYDRIFRAWDKMGSGFINGDAAKEIFGQSGLDSNDLMQIWYVTGSLSRSSSVWLTMYHAGTCRTCRIVAGSTSTSSTSPWAWSTEVRDYVVLAAKCS